MLSLLLIDLTKSSKYYLLKYVVKKSKQKTAKKDVGYRICFKTECAIVVTPYKQQGRTEKRMQMEIKNHASVHEL